MSRIVTIDWRSRDGRQGNLHVIVDVRGFSERVLVPGDHLDITSKLTPQENAKVERLVRARLRPS